MHNDNDKKFFERNNIPAPRHIPHFTDEERERFKVAATHQWRQEGNMLLCTCELGTHASPIPTNKMLKGTDPDGKPILYDITF
jgi:hypothetical protein